MKQSTLLIGQLLALRILSVLLVTSSHAQTTPAPTAKISELNPAAPNPAVQNEEFKGRLIVNLFDAGAHREISPPSGTTYLWKVLWVSKDGVRDAALIQKITLAPTANTLEYKGSFVDVGIHEEATEVVTKIDGPIDTFTIGTSTTDDFGRWADALDVKLTTPIPAGPTTFRQEISVGGVQGRTNKVSFSDIDVTIQWDSEP